MVAYGISYNVVNRKTGKVERCDSVVDAKDLNSARRKLARRHGYKDANVIKCESVHVIGYF